MLDLEVGMSANADERALLHQYAAVYGVDAQRRASAQRDLGRIDELFPAAADRSVMHMVVMAGWMNTRILELAGAHRDECARGVCRTCHHISDMLSMAIAFDQAETDLAVNDSSKTVAIDRI
jgi:hypothetical protein